MLSTATAVILTTLALCLLWYTFRTNNKELANRIRFIESRLKFISDSDRLALDSLRLKTGTLLSWRERKTKNDHETADLIANILKRHDDLQKQAQETVSKLISRIGRLESAADATQTNLKSIYTDIEGLGERLQAAEGNIQEVAKSLQGKVGV